MKIKSICRNQWQKKEALYKQTALVKAAKNRKMTNSKDLLQIYVEGLIIDSNH